MLGFCVGSPKDLTHLLVTLHFSNELNLSLFSLYMDIYICIYLQYNEQITLMYDYLNNFHGHFIAFLSICLLTQKILFHYLCNYCLQESLQLNSHRHENFTYSLL